MDISGSFMKVARVVAPIPAAIIDLVTDGDAPPAPPPPPPPKPLFQPPATLPEPTKDIAAARAKANEIWMGAPKDLPADGIKTIGGQDIQAPDAHNVNDQQALLQVYANRKLQEAALAKLSPEQRQQYEKLEAFFENDPQAHLALQMNLLEGKLTGSKTLKGDQDLLGALSAMSTQKVAPPLSNGQLLAEAVREIACPATIKQRSKNTCSVAALQVTMASTQPAEYVRILSGLAAEGNPGVTLKGDPNGKLQRPADLEKDDGSGRTATPRLWQGSFMALAAKAENATYDNKTDTVTWADGTKTTSGMTPLGAGTAAAKALGGDWNLANMYQMESFVLQELTTAKKPLKVTIGKNYDGAGNPQQQEEITITKMEGGVVTFKDKTGFTSTFTEDEFRAALQKAPKVGQLDKPFDRETMTDHMMAQIEDDVKQGQPSIALLRWGQFDGMAGQTFADGNIGGAADEGHFVTVTKIENGRVFFKNSQGSEDSMDLATFKNKLQSTVTQGPEVVKA